jgi:hypothetical protein
MSRKPMKPSETHPSKGSQRELAGGVLKQVAQDLRRFYNRTAPVERELYFDAYSWVMSDDCAWPFSFRNVCQSLDLAPDVLRDELIGDLALGTFGRWTRRCHRTMRRVLNSLSQRFLTQPPTSVAEPASLIQTSR